MRISPQKCSTNTIMLSGVARNKSYIRKWSNRHYISIRWASYNGGTYEEPKTGGAGLRVVAAAKGINRMMFIVGSQYLICVTANLHVF